MNKEDIDKRIDNAVTTWNEEKTVAQYFRNNLSQEDNGKKRIDKIIDNLYHKSIGMAGSEENEIKYIDMLLKASTLDQKPTNQINQQFNFGHDEFIMKKK